MIRCLYKYLRDTEYDNESNNCTIIRFHLQLTRMSNNIPDLRILII